MKTTEEHNDEEEEEASVSRGAAKEINVDAATAAVLSEPDSIFPFEEEQRTTLKPFLGGEDVLSLLPTGIGRSLVKHRRALWVATGRRRTSRPDGTNRKLPLTGLLWQ